MRNTIKVTDIDALAAFDNGKYVETREVKLVKHTPRRDLIRAALTLGLYIPGITTKDTEEVIPPPSVGAEAPKKASASEDVVVPAFMGKK